MQSVLLTALGVGGATVVGVILGFTLGEGIKKYSPYFMSLSAGIMLYAAVVGLILPVTEGASLCGLVIAAAGILLGGVSLYMIERLVPINAHIKSGSGAVLFSIAIAIHNLPEGIAAGVAFGSGDVEGAIGVVVGIALHNLPEGMIAITPLLAAGVGRRTTLLLALSGAVAEVIGTYIGYSAVMISEAVLPPALAFAGGTMLTVIAGEMIPDSKGDGGRRATLTLILGFIIMTFADWLTG